ncbi:hypothetical protein D5E69_14230 [Rossellomorea marisflavi]|uniref:hypothetical protein n=1 Tax=Rossellomorea marisflavi TaxID=189381 RepID=UPI001316EE83|nr:hypothetical protein [Rossellomorea marisflavi]QHA36856.1 hypothetical protein D5E69_14230 [Rossellomorea marisflavi]
MVFSISNADSYIEQNVIDIEDWQDADPAKKQRILNVVSQTFSSKYPKYVIPEDAVYEFAAVLASAYNDTNRLNNQGVASFSITGVASFNFKDTQSRELVAFIPQRSLDLIGQANGGMKLGTRRVGRSVR